MSACSCIRRAVPSRGRRPGRPGLIGAGNSGPRALRPIPPIGRRSARFLPIVPSDCVGVRGVVSRRGSNMKSVLRSGVLLATVLTAGAVVVAPSVAGAAAKPPATRAKVVGTVKIDKNDPSVGYVLAQYRCTVKDPVN